MKVTGSLQKSTEIMKLSSALVKLPQTAQVMREMSMEMTKASPTAYFTSIKDDDIYIGWNHGGDA